MLRKLEQSSDEVLGYEVEDKVTEEEFEAFSRGFEAAISRHRKVRLLIYTPEMPTMESGALWEDLKLARYRADIERYAVVGDGSLLEWGTELGDALIGGEVRYFETSRYQETWHWLRV